MKSNTVIEKGNLLMVFGAYKPMAFILVKRTF